MPEIPHTWNTVIVGTIEDAGIGGGGGPLARWYLVIRIEEQHRGDELPEPEIVLYLHSPVHEFPGQLRGSPLDADYTAPLIGTRWTWALDLTDTTVTRWERFPPP